MRMPQKAEVPIESFDWLMKDRHCESTKLFLKEFQRRNFMQGVE
jgi:hypothetical protein